MPRRPPRSPLFPYTTLFRSARRFGLGGLARKNSRQRRPAEEAYVSRGSWRRGVAPHRSSARRRGPGGFRSEEHTSELQSRRDLVCRLLLEKKKKNIT